MLPCLTVIDDFVGMIGGWVIADILFGLPTRQYWSTAWQALVWNDVGQGLLKPFVFSFVISLIGCFYGLRTTGGTQGVGRATTQAVVAASVSIFVLDLFHQQDLRQPVPTMSDAGQTRPTRACCGSRTSACVFDGTVGARRCLVRRARRRNPHYSGRGRQRQDRAAEDRHGADPRRIRARSFCSTKTSRACPKRSCSTSAAKSACCFRKARCSIP